MLQLQPPALDEWLIPVEGLRVKFRPPSSSVLLEARRCYLEWLTSGLVSAPDDEADEPIKAAYDLRFLLSAAYIIGGAIEWDGLGDETGHALTHPTAEQVLRLLHQQPAVFDPLDAQYSRRVLALVAEKNVSTPSPSGTSEREDTNTVQTAENSSVAAAASPAPTTSTSSKPRKAAASGTSSTPPAVS